LNKFVYISLTNPVFTPGYVGLH